MDTPLEEQQKFHYVTSKIAALESEFTEPNMLSIDNVIYVSFYHLVYVDCTIYYVIKEMGFFLAGWDWSGKAWTT